MELISLKEVPKESKILLLEELGYKTDGTFIFNTDGTKLADRYINQPIKIDNMIILPGSEIILDNNPLSIAAYFEEYGDVL